MLVLDANILIRAVLGVRVYNLIGRYAGRVALFAPDTAFTEARTHLPRIMERRGLNPASAMETLESLASMVQTVKPTEYVRFELVARHRIGQRDEDDWPVLATALSLKCAIWTEDTDFFGCGAATWTSKLVESYLRELVELTPVEFE